MALVLSFLLCVVPVTTQDAKAQTTELVATLNNGIWKYSSTTSYPNDPFIMAWSNTNYQAGILYKFDVSSLTGPVQSAIATIHYNNNYGSHTYTAYKVTSAWTSTVSFSNKPTWDGTPIATYTTQATDHDVNLDITALVNQWITGTVTNNGILVYYNAASGDEIHFVTKDAADNKPRLIVTTTPSTWAPSFTSSPPEIGQAGVPYSYTATLNETGTLAPVTLPAWATMTGSTVSGTPQAAGTYAFIIEATSTPGTLTARQYWNATIEEAATPTWAPSWTSTPGEAVYLGDTYTYTPTLNETATLEAIELPVWAGLVDGVVVGLPDQIGSYNFTLRATSEEGTLTADQSWQVNVTDAPIPVPQLLNQPQENGTERVWYSWTPSMSLSCSYTLNSTAGWLRIHPYTGEIYGLPSSGGLYLVVIEATSLDYATSSTLVYNLTIEDVLYQPGDEVVDDDPPATPGNGDLGTIGGVPVTYIGAAIILMLFIIVVLALATRRR